MKYVFRIGAIILTALSLSSPAYAGMDEVYAASDREDYAEAVKLLQPMVKQQVPAAQSMLGYLYSVGNGVPQDYRKAVELLSKAGDGGYVDAMIYLGWMYESGTGVAQSNAEATTWYQRASDTGSDKGREGVERLASAKQESSGSSSDESPQEDTTVASAATLKGTASVANGTYVIKSKLDVFDDELAYPKGACLGLTPDYWEIGTPGFADDGGTLFGVQCQEKYQRSDLDPPVPATAVQFEFKSGADGRYTIRNKLSGKCLKIPTTKDEGFVVSQQTCGGSASQMWLVLPGQKGKFIIQSALNGKVLGFKAEEENTMVHAEALTKGDDQQLILAKPGK